jgi:hypothetical protein
MDHAEARARLEELFLEPGVADGQAGRLDGELERHLAACVECATDHAALRATAAAIQLAMGPPPAARQRVLDNIAQLGRQRAPIQPTAAREARSPAPAPAVPFARALAAAAVLAVLAFIAGAISAVLLDTRPAQPSRLAHAATMMAELAREPTAQTMVLRDPAGEVGGTVIYEPNRRMLVVFSETLAPPSEGRYGCFIERDGERTWIGPMNYEAETSFWAGPLYRAPPDFGRPGDRFIVLRDQADPLPMLEADF